MIGERRRARAPGQAYRGIRIARQGEGARDGSSLGATSRAMARSCPARRLRLKLIERAQRGAAVVIARSKTPAARLVPYVREQPNRGFGSMKGRAGLDETFWEPLPEAELKLWEGWLQLSLPGLTWLDPAIHRLDSEQLHSIELWLGHARVPDLAP
jgi:antitoxin (DNA-binding transcriptional repressor) of toxin-antitoxin stability system